MKQICFFDAAVVDSFAGGGGASTGIELALGRPIDYAINHDESAIMMHKRNHPYTEHFQEDIWALDPKTITKGRPVRLAWFSPDCKHFSRAKGSALVDRNIRGLAWVVLRWAGEVRPDVIMLENVPEFPTWGPVRKGKPVKSKAGQTYRKWYKQLEDLGYKIETRNLCAADYGAPTIRTRFHLIARCDGKPIVWPERTHAPRDSMDVQAGLLKPWRSAAEIIDWSLPCYSIFESKQAIKEKYGVNTMRPLKENTMRRIARGLDKFVLKSADPFIVPIGYGENKGQAPRVHDIREPLSTVVSSTKQYVCLPHLTKFQQNSKGQSVSEPLDTVMAGATRFSTVEAVAMPYGMTNNTNNAPHDTRSPVPTLTTGNRVFHCEAVATPYIGQHKFQNEAQDAQAPLTTITSVGSHEVIAPSLIQYHSEQSDREVRGQAVDKPVQTVDASNRYGVSAAFLSEYYGNGADGLDVEDPMRTVTARDREGITLAHLAHFKGQDKGQHPVEPLMTITQRDGQFAEVVTKVVQWDGSTDLHYWPQVRQMLNEHCGYNLAADEILLLRIDGAWYFISDIGLRMLTPRELYDAMGFPHDYIIDRDVHGKVIPRGVQVARCGNAVCPAVAEALVRANLPECCARKLTTMEELAEAIVS